MPLAAAPGYWGARYHRHDRRVGGTSTSLMPPTRYVASGQIQRGDALLDVAPKEA